MGWPQKETITGLARADLLARRIVAEAAPLRFAVAQSSAELEAAFRLRYRVVIAAGWAQPEELADGLERDAYDDGAIHILAWDGEAMVGTTRLVLPTDQHPLPTEEAFDLAIEPRGGVADVGRICHAPGHREGHWRVWHGLLAQAWLELRARGLSQICAAMKASVLRAHRSLGLEGTILGAARPYWGEERYPVLIQPARATIGELRGGNTIYH